MPEGQPILCYIESLPVPSVVGNTVAQSAICHDCPVIGIAPPYLIGQKVQKLRNCPAYENWPGLSYIMYNDVCETVLYLHELCHQYSYTFTVVISLLSCWSDLDAVILLTSLASSSP